MPEPVLLPTLGYSKGHMEQKGNDNQGLLGRFSFVLLGPIVQCGFAVICDKEKTGGKEF